jgi:hypothetical protein
MPTPVRLPAKRAAGLDDELTAQPRPLSAEIGLSEAREPGMSVDPEDLGSHYLAEAVEQGEAPAHTALEMELSIIDGPASDGVLTPPNFEYENTLWEQTVDLTLQSRGSADELRAPPLQQDDDEREQDERPAPSESSIRELSLLDPPDTFDDIEPREAQTAEEGAALHESSAPPVASDEAARPGRSRSQRAVLPDGLRGAARWCLLRLAAALRRVAGV